MHQRTLLAFTDELEKVSAFIHPAADIAGLGILGVPSAKHLLSKKNRNTEQGKKERSTAKWELGGLGTLAAGVAHKDRHELGAGIKKGFGAVKNLITKRAMAPMTAFRPAIGGVQAAIRQAALKSGKSLAAAADKTAPLRKNIANFTMPTPVSGPSWRNNARAIAI